MNWPALSGIRDGRTASIRRLASSVCWAVLLVPGNLIGDIPSRK
jgi:hypothetical protein